MFRRKASVRKKVDIFRNDIQTMFVKYFSVEYRSFIGCIEFCGIYGYYSFVSNEILDYSLYWIIDRNDAIAANLEITKQVWLKVIICKFKVLQVPLSLIKQKLEI